MFCFINLGFFIVIFLVSKGIVASKLRNEEDGNNNSEKDEFRCSSWTRTGEYYEGVVGFEEPLFRHIRNGSHQPLEMCLFNQRNGNVVFEKKFALFEIYAVWLDLNRYLENTETGKIVVIHAEGKSIEGLRNITDVFVEFGSMFVDHLNSDSIWTFAFVLRGKTLFEKFINNQSSKRELFTSSEIVVRLSNTFVAFSNQSNLEKRWDFCQKYGAMGDLCEEEEPSNLINYRNYYNNSKNFDIPVIIMAGSRTNYFYYSLKSYMKATDAPIDNFYFVLGSNCTQTVELLNLFEFNYEFALPQLYGEEEFFQFLFYKEVYSIALKRYNSSKYIIFLEEDVEVSPDFFLYMNETVSLLSLDPTLYCVTGFSQTGLKYLAHDETSVSRADVQIGWGYAVTLNFVEYALSQWPTTNIGRTLPYDGWIHNSLANGKECVQPEVSRSRHFGIGISTKYLVSEKIYLTMPIARSPRVEYEGIKHLTLQRWKKVVRAKIKVAKLITNNVCNEQYLQKIEPGSYVIFYNFTNNSTADTFVNFSALGNCFKTWVYSMLGQHDYVNTIRIAKEIIFYLVAHPQSSYSDLCPDGHVPFDLRNLSPKDYSIYYEMNRFVQDLKYMRYEHTSKQSVIDSLFT